MKLLVILAIVVFANVCEINGATSFNLSEKLRSMKNSWTEGKKSDEPTLREIDTDSDDGSAIQKQIQASLDEAASSDSSSGRLFMKKLFLLGNTQNQNQQPVIIPIVISGGNGGSGGTVTDTITSTTTSVNDGTITLEPTARGELDDELENDDEVIEEEEIKEGEIIPEDAKANKKKITKKQKQKMDKNALKKGITFTIPQEYRKYFNNQKTFTIPPSMLKKAQNTQKNKNNKGTIKKRIVKRRPSRRN